MRVCVYIYIYIYNIKDSGIGISPAHLERIFEPFEQEDDGERRVCGGIGLGLSISREVVQRQASNVIEYLVSNSILWSHISHTQ